MYILLTKVWHFFYVGIAVKAISVPNELAYDS